MFWTVEVTTSRRDGVVVLDRSLAVSQEHARIMAEQTAILMFGDDYTTLREGHIKLHASENMFDDDVVIEPVCYDTCPSLGVFIATKRIN